MIRSCIVLEFQLLSVTSTGSREISGWEVTKLPGICNVSLLWFFSFFLWFLWRQIKLQHKRVLETQFLSIVLSDFSKISEHFPLQLLCYFKWTLSYCHLIIWKRLKNFRELTWLYQPQSLAWKLKKKKTTVWGTLSLIFTQSWMFMKRRKIRESDAEAGLVLSPVSVYVLGQVSIWPESLLLLLSLLLHDSHSQ